MRKYVRTRVQAGPVTDGLDPATQCKEANSAALTSGWGGVSGVAVTTVGGIIRSRPVQEQQCLQQPAQAHRHRQVQTQAHASGLETGTGNAIL